MPCGSDDWGIMTESSCRHGLHAYFILVNPHVLTLRKKNWTLGMNATHYRTFVNGKNEHVCSLSEIHFHHRNTPLKLVLPKLHIQLCGFKNLLYLLMNACYVWYKTELGENKILIDLIVSHCLTSIKGAQKANTPLSHVLCSFSIWFNATFCLTQFL